MSTLPLLVIAVLAFCVMITARARRHGAIDSAQARSVYGLLLSFLAWTLTSSAMGIRGAHTSPSLIESVPLLWQACVPMAILSAALPSRTLRNALWGIATSTPTGWLVLFQALRIGALGGVIKGFNREIHSSFVYWVGIPDFLFGLSAVAVGWWMRRRAMDRRFLMGWGLTGAAIILVPTFGVMSYWMNEPGFTFIFEFPMVLAPSVVVPVFILLNLLLAWKMVGAGSGKIGQLEAVPETGRTDSRLEAVPTNA